jgi:hypothetical protein
MKLNALLASLPAGTRVSPTLDLRGVLAMGGVGRGGVLYRDIPVRAGATCDAAVEWFVSLSWEMRDARLNGRDIEVYNRDVAWWPVLTLAS